jgi:tRNA (guanine-N7-)-methyltransferase
MGRINLLSEAVGQEFVARSSPPNWTSVFGFAGRLELEIGSGLGGFALEYARRFPRVQYVALERRRKFAREAQRRANGEGLKNIRFIEADARAEIPRLFEKSSVSAVRLHFPDPWWKRSHQKRLLVQADFARVLWDILIRGGLLDLRTDVEARAKGMLAQLEEVGFLNPFGSGVFHPADPDEIPSTRERRYLVTGTPVYRVKLSKPAS